MQFAHKAFGILPAKPLIERLQARLADHGLNDTAVAARAKKAAGATYLGAECPYQECCRTPEIG